MIDRRRLLKDLQGQVKALERDLREQVDTVGDEYERLRDEYDRAFGLGRTAATWPVWRDERVTQAAVAWALGTVFVRFCEDNGLLGSSVYLAGPEPERMMLAEESQEEYFRRFPAGTDRDWVLAAFDEIAQSQAGRLLFDREHNALYQIPVSHDAAKALIGFWRRRGEDGALAHDFTEVSWDTRFLGDLYQDLSEAARKTYALLQTPEFVEEFILDLTLTPAIEEFGHDVVKMIDPTCGSGHFLLGTFSRLLAEWERRAPSRDLYERVRLALDAVHGVDINPFAVAIAKFRLLVAALRAAGFATLAEAKGYEFPLHVAIGDSLIKHRQLELIDDLADFRYATEDLDAHPGILAEGRYHVVVGNPPYVTVKDRRLNELYREIYGACSGKYALSVPFVQRFFELGRPPDEDGRGAGNVGQITAASFASREFGKKLVEWFLPTVTVSVLIDCSKAFIPEHATSTFILAGRCRTPVKESRTKVVFSTEGEQREPLNPATGLVWQSIVSLFHPSSPGVDSRWATLTTVSQERLLTHPLVAADFAMQQVSSTLADTDRKVRDVAARVGVMGMTNADEIFLLPEAVWKRRAKRLDLNRQLIVGDNIRDWGYDVDDWAFFPYSSTFQLIPMSEHHGCYQMLWPFRTTLGRRATFSKRTYFAEGRPWHEWHQLTLDEGVHNYTIVFAFVATHNHFVLGRGHSVFKQSSPLIKLHFHASDDDNLGLIGLLNSSTANLWCRVNCHDKGGGGNGRGIATEAWEHMLERSGSRLQTFPLPSTTPVELARKLDALAQHLMDVSPAAIAASATPTRERLASAEAEWHTTRARMIALQEEIDWQVYGLYGLLDEELTAQADAVPELELGERAFEIVLAREMARGEAETQWFARHGSTPITELPAHWSGEYRAVVEQRIAIIEANRNIGLIERPECKRRWATEGWDAMQTKALREWLLDRSEARALWYHSIDGVEQPRPLSVAHLADELRRDPDVLAVAELYAPGRDLAKVLADLVADEHVPYLAALRYKDTGLDKRADWEDVWRQQREEDAATDEAIKRKIRDRIPVPPTYKPADFLKTSYWSNRGKLDVPKERFISYPHAGRDGDPSLLIGWAGWDHREQAQALAILVVEREQTDGWDRERIRPLLAGLREVLPWVRQWHGEFDPNIGDSPAAVYEGFLADTTNRLLLTDEDLTGWRPSRATRGRRSTKA
jgi:hypothetical protein